MAETKRKAEEGRRWYRVHDRLTVEQFEDILRFFNARRGSVKSFPMVGAV